MRISPLSFSVIIEWENAKLSELGRTRCMLSVLGEQILALDPSKWRQPEIVILYDPVAIDPKLIHETVEVAMGQTSPVSALKILPAQNMRYYELKNYGATQTEADVLVFLDSDVIPEPGWLVALLDGIAQPGVDVIGGNTYIAPESLYTRAFALSWFFPLRSEAGEPAPSEHFFANNVAFRKAVFDKHHFPCDKKFRGQCVDLASTLRENNYGLFLHPAARVSHPPPNGVYHFITRALCAGHDQVVTARKHQREAGIKAAWQRFLHQIRASRKRIRAHRSEVALGTAASLAAQGIVVAYYGLVFVGECITMAKPDFIPKRFPI
jgi:glycosyltransferase involved in cell wall biosynthesis